MSAARKRAERKWQRSRSSHATLLEGLEAAMRAHPAGGGVARRDRSRVVVVVPNEPNDAA